MVTLWSPAGHGGPEAVTPDDEAVPGGQAGPQPGHRGQGILQEAGLWQLGGRAGVSEAAVVYRQHFVTQAWKWDFILIYTLYLLFIPT